VVGDRTQDLVVQSCEARDDLVPETDEAREDPEDRNVEEDHWGHRVHWDLDRRGREDPRSRVCQAETDLGND